MLNNIFKSQTGQSFLEMIIAMVVVIVTIMAITFAAINGIRNAQYSQDQAQATKLAQEGIERVRSGRDKNANINDISGVNSWSGTLPVWNFKFYNDPCDAGSNDCYFNIDSNGNLDFIGPSDVVPVPGAELLDNGRFKRVVTVADNPVGTQPDYTMAKIVTSIVQWDDYSGKHQSKISTILGKQ